MSEVEGDENLPPLTGANATRTRRALSRAARSSPIIIIATNTTSSSSLLKNQKSKSSSTSRHRVIRERKNSKATTTSNNNAITADSKKRRTSSSRIRMDNNPSSENNSSSINMMEIDSSRILERKDALFGVETKGITSYIFSAFLLLLDNKRSDHERNMCGWASCSTTTSSSRSAIEQLIQALVRFEECNLSTDVDGSGRATAAAASEKRCNKLGTEFHQSRLRRARFCGWDGSSVPPPISYTRTKASLDALANIFRELSVIETTRDDQCLLTKLLKFLSQPEAFVEACAHAAAFAMISNDHPMMEKMKLMMKHDIQKAVIFYELEVKLILDKLNQISTRVLMQFESLRVTWLGQAIRYELRMFLKIENPDDAESHPNIASLVSQAVDTIYCYNGGWSDHILLCDTFPTYVPKDAWSIEDMMRIVAIDHPPNSNDQDYTCAWADRLKHHVTVATTFLEYRGAVQFLVDCFRCYSIFTDDDDDNEVDVNVEVVQPPSESKARIEAFLYRLEALASILKEFELCHDPANKTQSSANKQIQSRSRCHAHLSLLSNVQALIQKLSVWLVQTIQTRHPVEVCKHTLDELKELKTHRRLSRSWRRKSGDIVLQDYVLEQYQNVNCVLIQQIELIQRIRNRGIHPMASS